MDKKQIAKMISILTGLHVWFPILLVISFVKTGLTNYQIAILAPLLFFLLIVVPVMYVAIALKMGKVSSWDLPKKEERNMYFLVSGICTCIAVILSYYFGTQLFASLLTILFLLMVLLGVITIFWKISLHASLATASSIIINFFFHWQLPFLYFTIPLVAWARYTLRRHTISQLIAGIVVSALFLLCAFTLLGYI